MELLNPNNCFSIYKQETLKTIAYQDLLQNRRVLICSVVRPGTNLARQYINHLIEQTPVYQSLGIDDVYIINSADGRFVLARFEINYPQLTALYDDDKLFVDYLRTKMNKQQDLDTLSKYWSYQVLVNNGEIEKFYEQPTEKYIKNIVESGYKLHLGNHGIFAKLPEKVVLNRPYLRPEEQYFEMINIDEKLLVTGAVLYYNLWPNYPLQEYLKSV
jgi:hypothetical protein